MGVLIEVYQKLPDEKMPPLVNLDALRARLRLQSEAASAGIEGFISALQKKDGGLGEE